MLSTLALVLYFIFPFPSVSLGITITIGQPWTRAQLGHSTKGEAQVLLNFRKHFHEWSSWFLALKLREMTRHCFLPPLLSHVDWSLSLWGEQKRRNSFQSHGKQKKDLTVSSRGLSFRLNSLEKQLFRNCSLSCRICPLISCISFKP